MVHLVGEREEQTAHRDVLQLGDTASRVRATQTNVDLLISHRRGRRSERHELLPTRLGGIGLGGILEVLRGTLLHDLHVMEQAALLVVPPLQLVAHQLLTLRAGLRERGVRATVTPATGSFDHHDLGGDPLQQRAVVADHQDGGLAGHDLFLQPTTRGDVEVVVRFVQQQHVGSGGEQQVQHQSLALAARQFRDETAREVVDGGLHTALRRGLPFGFQFVTAEVTPVGQCGGVSHAVVRTVGQRFLGRDQCASRHAELRRRHLDEHLAQGVGRPRHAHVLSHGEHGTVHGELPTVGVDHTRQDAQDGALADAVGADQRGVLPGGDAETDVEEQLIGPGWCVFEFGDDDAAHRDSLAGTNADYTFNSNLP
ncbi:unannotated protein [freshwater metagenome]|uniref:Unannotated protein n=1 Tax=freshwater metagenome TaxID=449393 RepID=A0A6J6E9V8_9ZZZZ